MANCEYLLQRSYYVMKINICACRSSSVCILNRLQLKRPRSGVRFPIWVREFPPLHSVQTGSGFLLISRSLRRPKREGDSPHLELKLRTPFYGVVLIYTHGYVGLYLKFKIYCTSSAVKLDQQNSRKIKKERTGFGIFHIVVFFALTSYGLVGRYQRIGGIWRLHLQDRNIYPQIMTVYRCTKLIP
jgi:hypothetical protein